MNTEIHEECGVFGVLSRTPCDLAHLSYYGLYALQHRGQESCGIVVNDDGIFVSHKDMGLVGEVFSEDVLSRFPQGTMAVGHVRYGTTGGSNRKNCQPLEVNHQKGKMALAHNGNLSNAFELRNELELSGAIFHSTSDTETIAYIVTKERLKTNTIEDALSQAMYQLDGAYSLILMSSQKLICARDPYGFRPLCYGINEDGMYVVASESCALKAVGASFVRDIEPGEIVIFSEDGVVSRKEHCKTKKKKTCIFDYIYFARGDSVIDGISVHHSRKEAGRLLAKYHPVDGDVVIGVPDSGIDAALGYSQKGWRNLFGGDVGSYEPYADAVNRFYADRYGSLDAAKKTFETDPVGAFSDVMGALSLAGGVARGGAKVASVAGKTGAANALGYSADILRDIAKASDPMRMAAKAVTVPIGKAADVMGFSPEGLYAAALKQSTAAPVKKRDEAVKLGLRERVTPSRGGFYDLDTREKALQGEVGRIIDDKSGVGVTVDPWAVALRSLESLNNYLNAYTNAKGVKKEAWKAIDGFLDSHGERPLSLREAQDIKTKAQMEARKAFGETDITPQQHAAKALAYELRNEIEKAAPEVIPLNRRLSDLHKLDDAVPWRRSGRCCWRFFGGWTGERAAPPRNHGGGRVHHGRHAKQPETPGAAFGQYADQYGRLSCRTAFRFAGRI